MSIELVLGLGNPGPSYAETRHNVGFRVVDKLASRRGIGSWERYILSDLRSLAIGTGVIGAKPLTFMNRSGAALGWLLERFSLEPEQVLVTQLSLSSGSYSETEAILAYAEIYG